MINVKIAVGSYEASHSYSNPQVFNAPLISSIGNYSLADLHCQYKKYKHKRPKHILL